MSLIMLGCEWAVRITRNQVLLDKWRKETPYVTPVTMDIGYAMRNHILEEPFDIIKFLGWVTELKSMNVDTLIGDIPISFQSNNEYMFSLIQKHGLKGMFDIEAIFAADIKLISGYESSLFDRIVREPWRHEVIRYEDINNCGCRLNAAKVSDRFYISERRRIRDSSQWGRLDGKSLILSHDLAHNRPLYLCSDEADLDTFLLTHAGV